MRRSLSTAIGVLFIAGILLAGCSEVNGPAVLSTPTPDVDGSSNADTTASDTTVTTPTDTTVVVETDTTAAGFVIPAGTVRHSAEAPALLTYDTTFVAVQGQGNTFVLFYENPWAEGSPGEWFMKIDIPSDAEFVKANGEVYAYGDTVAITAEVDSSYFFVHFGPHGSTFLGKKSALLIFNAKFADIGDSDMAGIKVWYQPSAEYEWTPEETTVDRNGNRILIDIYHFSNYAVAW